jgi:hypothetical protein
MRCRWFYKFNCCAIPGKLSSACPVWCSSFAGHGRYLSGENSIGGKTACHTPPVFKTDYKTRMKHRCSHEISRSTVDKIYQ